MQDTFFIYFRIGIEHIVDLNAYDHLLFIIVLVSVVPNADWKKLFWLITSFTIGHSVSLAAAVFKIIPINSGIIEFLIPLTIFISAIYNIAQSKASGNFKLRYWFAAIFGLIHGMGFSNYLQQLLGRKESVWFELLSFNLGIEAGQIFILFIFLGLFNLLVKLGWIKQQPAIWVVNAFIAGISVSLLQKNCIF